MKRPSASIKYIRLLSKPSQLSTPRSLDTRLRGYDSIGEVAINLGKGYRLLISNIIEFRKKSIEAYIESKKLN